MRINEHGKWECYGGFNPISANISDHVDVAPHIKTLRSTYVVPKAKAAMIEDLSGFLVVIGAAITSGERQITMELTQLGGEPKIIFHLATITAQLRMFANKRLQSKLPLNSGDVLKIYTEDTSTGGVGEYDFNVSITEFDY